MRRSTSGRNYTFRPSGWNWMIKRAHFQIKLHHSSTTANKADPLHTVLWCPHARKKCSKRSKTAGAIPYATSLPWHRGMWSIYFIHLFTPHIQHIFCMSFQGTSFNSVTASILCHGRFLYQSPSWNSLTKHPRHGYPSSFHNNASKMESLPDSFLKMAFLLHTQIRKNNPYSSTYPKEILCLSPVVL